MLVKPKISCDDKYIPVDGVATVRGFFAGGGVAGVEPRADERVRRPPSISTDAPIFLRISSASSRSRSNFDLRLFGVRFV
jgi:hypothetical protein